MLIINADDLGLNPAATNRILECHSCGAVTSSSAMVFMADSERAAQLAAVSRLDTGLHLNFTKRFDGASVPFELMRAQDRVCRWLGLHRLAPLFYFPFLNHDFCLLIRKQVAEYERLFGKAPSHFDGHHHMHLSMNVLACRLLPPRCKVRCHFTFARGQKSLLNRAYRAAVNRVLRTRYLTPDYLFSLSFSRKNGDMDRILRLATTCAVELECHPEEEEDYQWLVRDGLDALRSVRKCTYAEFGRGGSE